MNSVTMIGRLCKEPELRRTQSGKAVASYSLAVKRPRSKDETDFVSVVTWDKAAEYLAQYGSKGDVVAVNGSLQSRKWEDKNGNKRTEWEVVTDSVELLSSKKNESNNTQPTQTQNAPYSQPSYAQQSFTPIRGNDEELPWEV